MSLSELTNEKIQSLASAIISKINSLIIAHNTSSSAHSQGSSNGNKNVVTDSNGNLTTEAKPTIPTKTSQLSNDSGFLTSHQDISGKIDTAGTGLSKSGTTLNHSNSVTAQTTASFAKIKYDAQGHITGTASVAASDLPSHTHSQYLTSHQSLDSKTVTVSKQATAESGYAATYVVKQNNTQVGEKINIPKDYLVKSATMGTVSTANSPVSGYVVGDKYLDFVINTKDGSATDEHIYINVKDLIDTYTAGTGLTLSDGEFSLTDASNYIKKSSSSGYIKNDGTIGTPTNTTYANGTGITIGTGNAINHSNSVTALTTASLKKIKYDAQGHITETANVSASDLPSHTHGNITNNGTIGTASGKPLITTTNGEIIAGAFGTSSGQFAEGNHTHNYTTSSDVQTEIQNFADALAAAINPSS